MKDSNFLKENNARHIWHPMGHPGELQTKHSKNYNGCEWRKH